MTGIGSNNAANDGLETPGASPRAPLARGLYHEPPTGKPNVKKEGDTAVASAPEHPLDAGEVRSARGVVHEGPPRVPLVFPPRGCVVPRPTAQQTCLEANQTAGSKI